MKVIFKECESKKVTIMATFDAGSNLEYNKWTPGTAHLVEHMIFQGTKDLSHEEIVKKMASWGVNWNAATYYDKVSFYINLPQENSLEASKLFSEMIFNEKFDQELFNKEKLVVLEEEKDARDNIDIELFKELLYFICKGPFSIPIIGNENSIKSITLEEAQSFHNTYYKNSGL